MRRRKDEVWDKRYKGAKGRRADLGCAGVALGVLLCVLNMLVGFDAANAIVFTIVAAIPVVMAIFGVHRVSGGDTALKVSLYLGMLLTNLAPMVWYVQAQSLGYDVATYSKDDLVALGAILPFGTFVGMFVGFLIYAPVCLVAYSSKTKEY